MNSDDPSRGVICPKILNRICFAAAVLSLVLIAATLLLMIWQYVTPEFGLKCIGSVLVILLTLLIFRNVNAVFVEYK